MKVFADKVNDVTMSGLGESHSFEVADGGKMVLTILRNAYSNPVGAIIRELSKNAEEVAGSDFRIHVPTAFEPWFSVIDNGTGLSHENTLKYFSGLGASTKDMDDTKAGGFGIGCKVPFSYCDDYQVIVRFNGKIRTYLAFLDDYQKPQFNMANEADTIQPNGVEVRVPVRSSDISRFREEIPKQLMFFDPVPKMNDDLVVKRPEYKYEGNQWQAFDDPDKYSYRASGKSRLIMGGLSYPIDEDQTGIFKQTRMCFHITLPIGTVPLAMSREELMYSDRTKEVIQLIIEDYKQTITETVQREVDKSETLYDAYVSAKVGERVLYHINVTDRISWKGYENVTGKWEEHTQPLTDLFKNFSLYEKTDISHYKNLSGKQVTRSDVLYHVFQRKFVVVFYKDCANKIPSTVKHNFSGDYDVLIVEESQAIRDKITEYGLDVTVMKWEDLEEPPKNTSRSAVKELYQHIERKTWGGPKNHWVPAKIDNLDRATGVYVDLSRWEIVGSHTWDHFRRMKELDIIPKDTILYGIPASRKNTLKDHPNFMSLDETYKLAEEHIEEMCEKEAPAIIKGEALRLVKNRYGIKKPLDKAEKSLYNKLSCLHIETSSKYKAVILQKYADKLDYHDELLDSLITSKYPLLGSIRNRVSDEKLAQYITQMEKL